MQVFLQLNGPLGSNLGPTFNLTTNVGVVTPATATSAQLLAGILVDVDNAATIITVTSVGVCTNSIIIPITNATTTTTAAPTTSTTTSALATTTTTTAAVTTTTTSGGGGGTTTTTTAGGGTTTTTTASGTTTTTTAGGGGTTTTTTSGGTTTTTTTAGGGTTTSTTTIGTTTSTTACVDSCLRIVNPDNIVVAFTLNTCLGIPLPQTIDLFETQYVCGTSIIDPGGTLVVTNLGNCSVCAQFTTTTSTTTVAPPTTTVDQSCYCYSVINETGSPSSFSYTSCNGTINQNVPIAGGQTVNICAIVNTVIGGPGVSVSGGTVACLSDIDCNP